METFGGVVEIRFVDPLADGLPSISEHGITPAFLEENCVAVSYIPIESSAQGDTAIPEIAAGASMVSEVVSGFQAEGYYTQYLLEAGNLGPTGIAGAGPSAFFIPPGIEHALPHVGHGIVWVYHHVSGLVKTASTVAEAAKTVETGMEIVERFRDDSSRPKRGGDLEEACTAARGKLALLLKIRPDQRGLSISDSSAVRPSGTFQCGYRYRNISYSVTTVYLGKGRYAVVSIKEQRP